MPGLDPKIAVHGLNIKADAKLIKQAQQRFHPLLMNKIKKKSLEIKGCGSHKRRERSRLVGKHCLSDQEERADSGLH